MSDELDDGYGGTLARKCREGMAREGASELAAPQGSAYNDECHMFFERQYAAMNLDDKTDFTRFEAMATVETFLHSIGVMGKPNDPDQRPGELPKTL